jgi:hypothetical protein
MGLNVELTLVIVSVQLAGVSDQKPNKIGRVLSSF